MASQGPEGAAARPAGRKGERGAGCRARKRLVQYGALAGLLAVVVVAALIIASQNNSSDSSGAGAGGDVADVSLVDSQPRGFPRTARAGRPQGQGQRDRVRRPSVPRLQGVLLPGRARHHLPDRPQGRCQLRVPPWDIIGPQSPDASRAATPRASRAAAGASRALLSQPGRGELGPRHRLVPDLDRAGCRCRDLDKWNSDRSDNPVGPAALNERQRRQEPRVHRHAVDLVEGPGGRSPSRPSLPSPRSRRP